MKRFPVIILALELAVFPAAAQFYTMGTEPASLKWSEMLTPSFRLVYPSGRDSLAKVYAKTLEAWKPKVGATLGYTPNEKYRRPMPVVLHTESVVSNGSVAWAPRRIDLLPTPDSSDPMPFDWTSQLLVHESRHCAQMQFPSEFKFLSAVSGELWAGAAYAIYGGQSFLEGDAVVAETELSRSGRGRTASFLEYYRVSREAGASRDYWQWRWGSLNRFTPDHYALGYLTIAGRRSRTGSPYYSRDFLRDISNHGLFRFFNLQRSLGKTAGKSFDEAFRDIQDEFGRVWARNDSLRLSVEAFTPATRVTFPGKRYLAYGNLKEADGQLFAVRSGLDRASEIVKIGADGSVRPLRSVSGTVGNLNYSPFYGRLYYTQTRTDPRWEMRSWSEISYAGIGGEKGSFRLKTRFFNPAPCGEGDFLYAVEYAPDGRCSLVRLGASNGVVFNRIDAPSGVQFSEVADCGDRVLISAVTSEGSTIYALENGRLSQILPPSPVSIKELFVRDGALHFTSDRDGTDQLYRLSPDGKLAKLTNTRFGATDFTFIGDTLYFTAQTPSDRGVWKTAAGNLSPLPVDWSAIWRDPIAETLSAQAASALAETPSAPVPDSSSFRTRRYSKAAHLFRFHSWLPVYVDYDSVRSMSAEDLYSDAGLGATAFFHNDLNTLYGSVALSGWTPAEGFTPGFHARASYYGLYPVIEGRIDITGVSRSGSLKTYIPWNFSSNGWNRGLIPQFSVAAQDLCVGAASLRGYIMRARPSSCIFPRWGIGAEIGVKGYLGANPKGVKPLDVEYVYAYLPGIARTHGLNLSAKFQQQGRAFLNEFTATYAFPFADLDWSGPGPVAYLRNFEARLGASLVDSSASRYWGVGATLNAVLGNLLWIPYDTRLGLSAMYYPSLKNPLSLSLVFSVDL